MYAKLSGIGTHSGTIIPVADRLPKNSNASLMASLISRARVPRMSAPKSASATIRSVRSLKSSYTSRTDRIAQSFFRSSRPALAMALAYVSTAALRNAGLESLRCLAHESPSLTSRPSPAKLDPGKNAVPSLTNSSARSIMTSAATVGSETRTTRSPARERPTTSPWSRWVLTMNASGSAPSSTAASPAGPGGNPWGGGAAAR